MSRRAGMDPRFLPFYVQPMAPSRATFRPSSFAYLPTPLIIKIISHLPLADLLSFVTCNRHIYHIFLLHRGSLLTAIIKRLYGRVSTEALLLLHYQRPSSPAAPVHELPGDFVATPEDITHMYRNHRIFVSVSRTFARQQRAAAAAAAAAAETAYPATRSPFEAQRSLSVRHFFTLWVHSLHFQNDAMSAFLHRQRLQPHILHSLHDVSRAIMADENYATMKSSTNKPEKRGSVAVPDLFFTIVHVMPQIITDLRHLAAPNDHIIRMKIVQHYVVTVLAGVDEAQWDEVNRSVGFRSVVKRLMDQFGLGGQERVQRLVREYGLEKASRLHFGRRL